MRRPPSPVVLLGAVVLIGAILLMAVELGRGGIGAAHLLGGLVILVVSGAFAMLRGGRR